MKLLLDESLPRRLKHDFPGHQVITVQQCGWSGVKNGELLRRARAAAVDVLITADQNLEYQQNLSAAAVAVVVLAAPSNRYDDLRPLARRAVMLLDGLTAGRVVRVTALRRKTR